MAVRQTDTDTGVEATISFLTDLLADYHPRDVAFRLWDGTTLGTDDGRPPRCTIVLRHPGALRAALLPAGELTMAEAYLRDDLEIEGEIEALLPLATALISGKQASLLARLTTAKRLLALPSSDRPRILQRAGRFGGTTHTVSRDRETVTFHYDRSNDFFAQWLDRRMVYSCAYFADPCDDLDMAQERKLDYLCRKLRLRSGERMLDIGCGWGGLVIHAAARYGANALGITLSHPQVELARQRIDQAGVRGLARVEAVDYREVEESEFDKIVSVGMVEHVGEAKLPAYFAQAYRLLKPGGVFLLHGIASAMDSPQYHDPTFINRYVFPDGELLPISTTLRAAELAGFEVRDVENLREHYTLTLRHWVRRLEAGHDAVVRAADEVTYRIWRLYMAGSAWSFASGRLNLYQTLLSKPEHGRGGLPLTRADWYA